MPNPPTPEELEGWEKMLDLVTVAPWFVTQNDEGRIAVGAEDRSEPWMVAELCACLPNDENGAAHAEFIATARTAMPALLAEVKRLREERDAWKALCEAKNGLLMAYRTGNSSRIDAVLTRIEKAKDRLTALDAAATPQASPKPLPDDLRTPRTTPRL